MAKVKSDLKDKPVSEKIQITRNRYNALTNEGVGVAVDSAKANNYKAATDKLEASEGKVVSIKDALKLAVEERNTDETNLEKCDLSIVNEINSKTDDVNVLLTTGFPLASERGNGEPLDQVENLSAATGDDPGEIDINFNRVKYATGYEYQISADNPDSWTNAGASGKTSKYTFNGLTPGRKYWIRVRAFKGEEKGLWSNPVSTTAPY